MSLWNDTKLEIARAVAHGEAFDVSAEILTLDGARKLARETQTRCAYYKGAHRYSFFQESRILGIKYEHEIA
jgi:hypothetical protein